MAEQKLKKVDARLRQVIRLTTDTNRRMSENYQREQQRRHGRGVCTWCGAQSCGHLWSKPGEDIPGGERCCDRCSHTPVEGWQHTHTAWNGAASYPVCAVRMEAGDVVYLRRDGVAMFLEMQKPAPPDSPTPTVPTVSFLGEDGGSALYTAGEGAAEHTNLWDKKHELDIVWLPIRMSAAVSADESRKRLLAAELQREADEWQKKEDARRASEKAKLEASIDKRQLVHETRVVMDEMGERGELDEISLEDDDEADDEDAQESEADRAVEAKTTAEPVAPPKLSLAELKKPRPVKKGPGRPKRSKRQRDARKRQKKAWAKQEAAQRLEVKRFERAARNSAPPLVKEDE